MNSAADAKLRNEHLEGLALDARSVRLAAEPFLAAAEAAVAAARQAADIAELDAIQLTLPARRAVRGRR